MRRLSAILCISLALCAQTHYPSRVDTDADLGVAANQISTQLAAAIGTTDTSLTLRSGTGIVPNVILTINGGEFVWVCSATGPAIQLGRSSCPNVDGRGVDGSIPATHKSGEAVEGRINAWYHNSVRSAVEAVEASLSHVYSLTSYNLAPTTTCGLQEALNQVQASAGGTVTIPSGFTCTATAGAVAGAYPVTIQGPGQEHMSVTLSANGLAWLTVGTGAVLVDGVHVQGAPIGSPAVFGQVSTNTGILIQGVTSGTVSQGNYGSVVRNSWLENFQIGLDLAHITTVSVHDNQLVNNNQGIVTGNKGNGDSGLGQIYANTLICYDGIGNTACTNHIEVTGPGGGHIHHNNMLGGMRGVLVDLTMGTVSTAGTAVTLVSGGPFLANWAGQQCSISGVTYTIATVNGPSSMTLTSSAGTQSATPNFYFPAGTSEFHIDLNTIDLGAAGYIGIDFETSVPFGNVTVLGNIIDKFTFTSPSQSFFGVHYNSGNLAGVVEDGNYMFSGTASTTAVCQRLAGGSSIKIGSGDTCRGFGVGTLMFSGGPSSVNLGNVSYFATTVPLNLQVVPGLALDTSAPLIFAQLPASTPGPSSRVFCQDCDTPASSGAPCSSSGDRVGADARYLRGAWRCY